MGELEDAVRTVRIDREERREDGVVGKRRRIKKEDFTCVLCEGFLQKTENDGVIHHKVSEVAFILNTHTHTHTHTRNNHTSMNESVVKMCM